jgi:hypothetical protein
MQLQLSGAHSAATAATQLELHATVQQRGFLAHTFAVQSWRLSHPRLRLPPVVQSEWLQLPCAGATQHAPLLQLRPCAHALPQAPQFFGSVILLVQPLQQSGVAPEHCVPHAPQFSASVAVLLHIPPQHVSAPLHGAPQPPQFSPSVRGSTHCPPQISRGAGQPFEQAPSTHAFPVPQSLPQLPQFFGSLFVFVHTAPHAVALPGHVHTPSTHEAPFGHVPHPPPSRAGPPSFEPASGSPVGESTPVAQADEARARTRAPTRRREKASMGGPPGGDGTRG